MDIDERLSRLEQLLDLYRFLPPGGQDLIREELHAVLIELLGLADG